DGLRGIARRVHARAAALAAGLRRLGLDVGSDAFFDTLRVRLAAGADEAVHAAARAKRVNLRRYEDGSVGVALDETTTLDDVKDLLECFAGRALPFTVDELAGAAADTLPAALRRTSDFLTHPVFNRHHSEHEML